MSASLSPDQYGGDGSQGSPESALPSSNFFKSLSEKRATRSSNPPKRRGPKPDSKPALTRRQELNRQAQRTHRERKEFYIKALEDEVLRLKEIFSAIAQDKQTLADENKQLKELLIHSGIHYPGTLTVDNVAGSQSGVRTSTTSVSGHSFAPGSHGGFSPPVTTQSTVMSMSPPAARASHQPPMQNVPQLIATTAKAVDLEQAGIDFVLTLEKPCMAHIPFLVERANGADGKTCGHALMASYPPAPVPELTQAMPLDHTHTDDTEGEELQGEYQQPCQAPWGLSINKADLSTLLDLSKKLELDGEITPVMAWGMVLSHPRARELIPADFEKIAEELLSKVRCFGFGAVMEEFELRDAMESVLSTRADAMVF